MRRRKAVQMSSIYAKYGADMTCTDCSGELLGFLTYLFPLVRLILV